MVDDLEKSIRTLPRDRGLRPYSSRSQAVQIARKKTDRPGRARSGLKGKLAVPPPRGEMQSGIAF